MLISEHDEELRKNLDPGIFNDDDFITRNDSVIESSAFDDRQANRNMSGSRRNFSGREQLNYPNPVNAISSKIHATGNKPMNYNKLLTSKPNSPMT